MWIGLLACGRVKVISIRGVWGPGSVEREKWAGPHACGRVNVTVGGSSEMYR